jgi:proteasome assembly chaperone 2
MVPLLRAFHSNSAVPPTAAVVQYVLEGDNREDAVVMATIAARALGVAEQSGKDLEGLCDPWRLHVVSCFPPEWNILSRFEAWKEPSSWKQGLFGAPHDQTLFG